MDELLLDRSAPRNQDIAAEFDPALTGGVRSGWRARVTPFETRRGGGLAMGSRPRGTRNLVDERPDAATLCARRISPQHPAARGPAILMRCQCSHCNRRGVTLLELMIAITLVAGLSTGMLMAMRTSLLTYEKTAHKLESNRRFVKTQQILSNQIGGGHSGARGMRRERGGRPLQEFLLSEWIAGRAAPGHQLFDCRRRARVSADCRISRVTGGTRRRAAGGYRASLHRPGEHQRLLPGQAPGGTAYVLAENLGLLPFFLSRALRCQHVSGNSLAAAVG